MAFTMEEMAVLSQLSYFDIVATSDQPVSLHSILNENLTDLKTKLGTGYDGVLIDLLEKTNGKDYTIVLAENDRYGTGFAAFAVKDPNNNVTVACRGTEGFNYKENADSKRDVETDIQIGLQKETNQQQKLEDFIRELEKKDYAGYYFTGHSLGGNLAILGAISVGDSDKVKGVVTFNAPGFHNYYWMTHSIKIEQVKGKIINIENEYDYVSSIFTKPGATIYVESNFSSDDYDPRTHHNLNTFKIGKGKKFTTKPQKGQRQVIPGVVSNGVIDFFWNWGIIGQYFKAKITGAAKTGFRDFSKSALSMMTDIAKEVEDEDWWDITRWDCWYRVDQCLGGFIMDYQLMSGDIDTYYRKIIDMNDASAKEIKKIFENAYEADKEYAGKISQEVEKMKSVSKKMKRIAASVNPAIHTGTWGGTADGSQIPNWRRGDLAREAISDSNDISVETGTWNGTADGSQIPNQKKGNLAREAISGFDDISVETGTWNGRANGSQFPN